VKSRQIGLPVIGIQPLSHCASTKQVQTVCVVTGHIPRKDVRMKQVGSYLMEGVQPTGRSNITYRVVQKNGATLHFPKYLENYFLKPVFVSSKRIR